MRFFNKMDAFFNKHLLLQAFFTTTLIGIMCISIIFVGIYIFPNESYDKLSFFGSVFGGGITLIGVWLTIFIQNVKRKEELSIQYKPHLEIVNFLQNTKENGFINGVCGIALSDNPTNAYHFILEIKNNGLGECHVHSLGTLKFKSENESIKILQHNDYKESDLLKDVNGIIQKNWKTIIPVQSTMKIGIGITYMIGEMNKANNLTLILPLEYTDQFNYKNYNAQLTLKFKVVKGIVKNKIKLSYTDILNVNK